MELFGKFGKHNNLKSSIGLSSLGQQFWNLTPAELIEDCIITGDGMLTDTGSLAIETGELLGVLQKTVLLCAMKLLKTQFGGEI